MLSEEVRGKHMPILPAGANTNLANPTRHGTGEIQNSVQAVASKHDAPVKPILNLYQQLTLAIGYILLLLNQLFDRFKASEAPSTDKSAQQNIAKMPAINDNTLQDLSQITDFLIQSTMQERRIPSVVVSIIHQGQVIKTAAYGHAQDNKINPDDKLLAADTQTVYRLDSLSKQFTATGIIKLVEQNVVQLDMSIHHYINNAPPGWEQITVRQLLTHHAGFPYQLSGGGEYPSITEQDQFPVPADYLTQLFSHTPEPGKHIYSNIGYEVLGVIIKNVTQKSYSAFMQETFFTPLHMSRTSVSANAHNTDNFAIGYALQPGPGNILAGTNSYPDIINEDIPLAGAGMLSTIEDMAKWELALQGNQVLSDASKQVLWESLPEVWAPGKTDNGATFLSASGVGWGYNTSFIRYPASQSAVIVMANFDGTGLDGANIPALASEIAQLYPLG